MRINFSELKVERPLSYFRADLLLLKKLTDLEPKIIGKMYLMSK